MVKVSLAKTVEFLQDIMYRLDMPNRIITDLGSLITSAEFKSWSDDCRININYASVAHQQANGQVECANGLLLQGLKPRLYKPLKKFGDKWMQELPKVV